MLLSEFIVEDSRQAKFNCVEKIMPCVFFKIHLAFSECKNLQQFSPIFICLVKCLLVPQILRILINLNFLYYPRVMYLAKHGNTQFFFFSHFWTVLQNQKMRPCQLQIKVNAWTGSTVLASIRHEVFNDDFISMLSFVKFIIFFQCSKTKLPFVVFLDALE